jgi:HTH-type transcriptional regulator / antitoxin HigA
MGDLAFNPDWVSPPGETITDVLRARGVTEADLAHQLGLATADVQRLIEGRQKITTALAEKLAAILGGSARFWLAREQRYREGLSVLAAQARDKNMLAWLKTLPVRDMSKFGWIPTVSGAEEQVPACLQFFGVRDLTAWNDRYRAVLGSAIFRTSQAYESRPGAVAAWLRRGEQLSAAVQCAPWDLQKFNRTLKEVRPLTRESDPDVFLPKLQAVMSACGVAVVILRAPDRCRASGATRFLTRDKALMLLSFRYLADDQFWFSVFHEAGHLVLHRDRIMVDAPNMPSTKEEEQADQFALDVLIPAEHQAEMFKLPVNGRAVMRFARKIGISPGVVVGQMQHLKHFTYRQLNNLKRRYKWRQF